MTNAADITNQVIQSTLAGSPAYRRVDDNLYVVKQGSAYVMINVLPWDDGKCMVRCVAQMVKGLSMSGELSTELLKLNAHLRFGAFAYDPIGELVLFIHSILGGSTLDSEELLVTVREVALVADEYDDQLSKKYGGRRMKDLIEDAAMRRILNLTPDTMDLS